MRGLANQGAGNHSLNHKRITKNHALLHPLATLVALPPIQNRVSRPGKPLEFLVHLEKLPRFVGSICSVVRPDSWEAAWTRVGDLISTQYGSRQIFSLNLRGSLLARLSERMEKG